MPKQARYDAVIIGSGFGGSVMALRLAQAGRSVCVLERGRRWAKEDFPRTPFQFLRCWWTGRREGLYDFRFTPGMGTLGASGVGGGSLIYSNVLIRAGEEAFANGGWPREIRGRAQLDPYYDLAADMFRIRPAPKVLPKTQAMEELARRLGRERDLVTLDLAVHFAADGQAEGQIIDDPFGRGGPPQATCIHCGGCVSGCSIHAKNTLDLNYLWLAERKYGAEIAPLHEAGAIRPEQEGYRVHFWQRERGRRNQGTIWGKTVILSAGAVGSTELLLRSKRTPGGLPCLSDALGLHFSGNGDLQAGAMAIDPRIPVKSYLGPIITRGIQFGDNVFIEDGAVSHEFAAFMEYLYTPFVALASQIGARLRGHPLGGRLRKFLPSLFCRHAPLDNSLILLMMGRDAADGKLRLSRRGKLEAQWDNRGSRELFDSMEEIVRQVARELGGIPYFGPGWALRRKLITVHPLGGCAMADSYQDGVVNHLGEVFHYPGLYVVDGASIPAAIGKNPAMTIAALAERTAFWMVHGREMSICDERTRVVNS